MKRPTVLLRNLLIDFGRLEPSVKGLDRDIRTIERRFKHEGYGFLTVTLPALGDAVLDGLSQGQFSCPTSFRKASGSALPRFLSGLLSEVFDPISGLVKSDPSSGCITSIHQLCRTFKKVRLDDECSDKLHLAAVDEFFRCDQLIDRTYLSNQDADYYRTVCSQLLPSLRESRSVAWLDDATETEFKHGPGAVAEGYRPNQKWKGVYEGILADAFDTGKYRYDLFALMSRIDLSSNIDTRGGPDQLTFNWGPSQDSSSQQSAASGCIARLVSVPKNSTSRRTITIEPLLNQFLQQGANIALRDAISKCGVLSRSLALSDQGLNQKLALDGSLTGEWSTLDLKSASDLLSLRLVRQTFSHVPEFLEDLIECRTTHVESSKWTIQLSKYAGMGNATTFPVQSVVFAALAITAVLSDGKSKPSTAKLKRASRCVRVFGDDIIVKTEHVHSVVDWLQKAGLIVNQKKSFLNGFFKESCGVDAYRGVDVTPLYLRHRPDDSSTDPNAIAGLVAFSNNAWMRGLYKTSAVIMREVEDRLGYSLPLVSRNSSALGWHSRVDAMDSDSWNPRLQCLMLKAPVLVSPLRQDTLDDWPALLKFFHVPLIGRPPKHLQQSSVRYKLNIAKKRVPTRVG